MLWFVVLVCFFVIATVYSSVGFAGGSSYLAVLAWLDWPTDHIRWCALVCNLVVSFGGTVALARQSIFPWRFLAAITSVSMPAAYFASQVSLNRSAFLMILGLCLVAASLSLMMGSPKREGIDVRILRWQQVGMLSIGFGLPAGILAGLTSIGGGIYLAPILHLAKTGTARQVAAICSGFIFLNSMAGLVGRLRSWSPTPDLWWSTLWLAVSVFAGGQIGSYLLRHKLSARPIRLVTAVLILLIAIQLIVKSLYS